MEYTFFGGVHRDGWSPRSEFHRSGHEGYVYGLAEPDHWHTKSLGAAAEPPSGRLVNRERTSRHSYVCV